jgi:uncharacterized protein YkwD
VNCLSHKPLLCLLAVLSGFGATRTSRADPITAMQLLREGGCGGVLPPARPLHQVASLDRAAEAWASGRSLTAAAQQGGYQAGATAGLHVTGPESSMIQLLKQSGCRTVLNQAMHDAGVYQHGANTWVVLASANVAPANVAPANVAPANAAPANSQGPVLATRALQLVNEVRARGARCGERSFGPAPPVKLSDTLAGVAFGHANDMARHNYFEHEDLSGRSPADRVRAVGYQEKLVGENIAYGPKSADEVVQGWLDSPGHCENIMDPRFAEMGIAYATGQSSRRGLFWVQLLVAPKA